jgi:hypothetical protein
MKPPEKVLGKGPLQISAEINIDMSADGKIYRIELLKIQGTRTVCGFPARSHPF